MEKDILEAVRNNGRLSKSFEGTTKQAVGLSSIQHIAACFARRDGIEHALLKKENMDSALKRSLLVGLLIGLSFSTFATEGTVEKKQPESVIPVTQVADWAVEWWGPRHEEKVREIKRGDIDLLMIGDSITHGWETRGTGVWEKYYKRRKAANLGFSGDRTEHVLWRLENGEVEGISPRLVILMIGTNNTGTRKGSAADTAQGIAAIIKELRTRLPGSRILLLAIFPRAATADDELRTRNDAINKIISGMADNKQLFYLDINGKFLDEAGNLSKEIMPDLLHPNERGYEIWAKAMEPTISKLMSLPTPISAE